MNNTFGMYENVVPLLAPVDIASTVTASPYMDLKGANHAAFLVMFGAITSATLLDTEDITVEAATAVDGTEASISFSYRKSGAVGANTWGTIASATLVAMAASVDDNMAVWIDIDPDALAASDYRYVRVKLTDNPDMTACLAAVVGFIDPRYKKYTMTSVTASASA